MSDSPKQDTTKSKKSSKPAELEADSVPSTEPELAQDPEPKDPEPKIEEDSAEPESTATDKPEAPAPAEPAKEAEPASKSGKMAILLGILCLLLIIAVAGFGHYRFTQLNESLQGEGADIRNSLSEETEQLNSQLSAFAEDLNRAQEDREAQNLLVDRLQTRLTDAIKQVEAGRQTTTTDWRLAEAEYLLRLANQRILMEGLPEGALALLKSTDEILRELDDVTLFDLREEIAQEIASLEAVPKLDVQGTYLRLSAMIGQTRQLATMTIEQQRELPEMLSEITPDLIDETMQQEITGALSNAMTRLESLVVIQHHDEPVQPLLSPALGDQARQNLELLFTQTQLAMLRQQQDIFDQSLTRAEEIVDRYFDGGASSTQAMLTAIQSLKTLQVSPDMPDISGSLALLKRYVQERTELGLEASR